MVECNSMLVAFFLSVNIFFQVSVQALNVSVFLSEHNEDKSHALKTDSKKTQLIGLTNESFYDGECDCGFGSEGCRYEYGEKICDCIKDFAQYYDRCEPCFCGTESYGCSYLDGRKTCSCKFKHVQNNNGECEKCDCGTSSYKCYFENNNKMCSCYQNYKRNSYGECVDCDCGEDSESCELIGDSKNCTCKPGYFGVRGKCERCDCGPMSSSCYLTYYRYARCQCYPGYVAVRIGWRDHDDMDEQCKFLGLTGLRLATYIESIFFGSTFLICVIIFCRKRFWQHIEISS